MYLFYQLFPHPRIFFQQYEFDVGLVKVLKELLLCIDEYQYGGAIAVDRP